jgi:hypothetical protein
MYKEENDETDENSPLETGSDNALADDDLRLPEGANVLVRLHALRAWLERKIVENEQDIGFAALALQEVMKEGENEPRQRRRFTGGSSRQEQVMQDITHAQERQSALAEAHTLLEDIVAHTTTAERVLVEYFLSLEELVQSAQDTAAGNRWLATMSEVMGRVEQVSISTEED